MKENELKQYNKIGNWDFSQIDCITERLTSWDFYEKIKENSSDKSFCLDLGTGGGENVLKKYPNVGMIIATDLSKEMLKTAKNNLEKYSKRNVRFACMDNREMTFPEEIFDVISARHTVINAKQIYSCLVKGGTLVIEGIDKKDCLDIKRVFKRGQDYNDEISIAEKDYNDLLAAGFTNIEKVEILENEYYKTEQDLMKLLLKTPIINDFTKMDTSDAIIEKDLFDQYVKEYKTEKGILLKRVLYGIVAKK